MFQGINNIEVNKLITRLSSKKKKKKKKLITRLKRITIRIDSKSKVIKTYVSGILIKNNI